MLYVTYDGLTDPLGEAQILPYVRGLAELGYAFDVLSFEKPDRFREAAERIRDVLDGDGVTWHPQRFSTAAGPLSKLYDGWRMRTEVRALDASRDFDLIHCRSYPATDAALALRDRGGPPYVFDMRGFWVDERFEGGIWPDRPPYRWLYPHLKRRERRYLASAGGVVSLTHAAVREMESWEGIGDLDFEVIPCSVDTALFSRSRDGSARAAARRELGIGADDLVVGYLGSVGTWYLLDEMMELFRHVHDRRSDARFLFVSREPRAPIEAAAEQAGVPADRLVTVGAARADVPRYVEAFDVSVFFIRPSYSKTASSPTKLGELMAMGVPVVTNSGVGDVDRVVEACGAGLVLPDLTGTSLASAAARLDDLRTIPSARMIEGAREHFDLGSAVRRYATLYRRILGERGDQEAAAGSPTPESRRESERA